MRNFWLGGFALFALLAICSCSKPTLIGSEIIPGEDNLSTDFTDTLTVLMETAREDSLITNNLSSYSLGTIEDPDFGKTYAGIFSQVRLPSNDLTFPDNPTIDSVVLTLRYSKPLYGVKSAPHTVAVYKLTESLVLSTPYTSAQTFAYEPVELGRKENFVPNLTDNVVTAYGDTLPPHLRIRLDDAFGQLLLDQSGTTNFSTSEEFLKFFKGIYIAPDTSNGFSKSMMFIDLLSSLSGITLYYKNDIEDSLDRTFVINVNSAFTNHFIQNLDSDIIQQLISPGQDSIGYIMGLSGLRIKVQVPYISDFENISINKAELVITSIENDTVFAPPSVLVPRVVNSTTGGLEIILDERIADITGAYNLGGTKEEVIINGQKHVRYRINLVKHLNLLALQQINDKEIVIRIPGSQVEPGRVMVAGGNHPVQDLKMKINLFYTKL